MLCAGCVACVPGRTIASSSPHRLATQYLYDSRLGNMPHSSNSNLSNGDSRHGWPSDVGILAMDIYFPHQYVDQVGSSMNDGTRLVLARL